MTQQLMPTNVAGQQVILVVSPVVANGDSIVPLRMLYGSGAPGNNVGDDKEFYLNIDNYRLYGPKIGGLWGDGYLLKGDKGDAGQNGKINMETIATLVGGTGSPFTFNLDLSQEASMFTLVLQADENAIMLQNTSAPEGMARTFTMILQQGTGSSRVTTWDPRIRWPDNVKPTLSFQSGMRDIFHFVSLDRGDSFIPFYLGGNFPV